MQEAKSLDGVLPLNAPRKTPKVVKQMNELKEPKQMIDEEHEEITMSKAGWVHLNNYINVCRQYRAGFHQSTKTNGLALSLREVG